MTSLPSVEDVLAIAARHCIPAASAALVREGNRHRATYRLDDRFIIRFALDPVGEEDLKTELTVLPALAAIDLGIRVPRIVMHGQWAEDSYLDCTFVPGRSGELHRPGPERWPELAEQMGRFLSAVHSLPESAARVDRDPDSFS